MATPAATASSVPGQVLFDMAMTKLIPLKESRIAGAAVLVHQRIQSPDLLLHRHGAELSHLWPRDFGERDAGGVADGEVPVLRAPMLPPFTELRRKLTALLAIAGLLLPTAAAGAAAQTGYTFKAQTELVLVNVTVRDKNGNPVRDLKPEDFTVLEDNKPQKVATFDIENTQNVQQVPMQQANLLSAPVTKTKTSAADAPAASAQESAIKDRRLIILFFDLSSMQPDEIERSANAAQDYLNKQMEPADLVSIVSLGNTITVNQDFTSDRDKLKAVLQSFNVGANAGFELGSTGTTEGTPDTGAVLHGGRHRVQHLQHRPAIAGVARRRRAGGQRAAEEVADLFLQRNAAHRHREPVAVARRHQLGRPGQPVDLHARHSRTAGAASRRRGAERQPARNFGVLRAGRR